MSMVPEEHARGYQFQARDFLLGQKRCILALPPGAGKSLCYIMATRDLDPGGMNVLCVGSSMALRVLQDEWSKWGLVSKLPVPTLLSGKKPQERKTVWESAQCIGTTYQGLLQDTISKNAKPPYAGMGLRRKFDLVIADEVHMANNHKKQYHKALKRMTRDAKYVFLVTGTPASRGPQDLWGLLNICDAKEFSSYWRYVYTYCAVIDTPFGREIAGATNPKNLMQSIQHRFYYRSKKEILPELPDKIRQKIPVSMEPKVQKIYDDLEKDLVTFFENADGSGSEVIMVQNTLTASIALRQLLVCPALVNGSLGVGKAFEGVVEYLQTVKKHCVIFTPFKQALPHMEDYLTSRNIGPVYKLQGGMTAEEIRAQEKGFKEKKGIMLCTIAVAESFSLETCDTAHFVGVEWTPRMNYQAEDRIHRMTSTHDSIHVMYWVYENTIDDTIFEVLDGKQQKISPILAVAETLSKKYLRNQL